MSTSTTTAAKSSASRDVWQGSSFTGIGPPAAASKPLYAFLTIRCTVGEHRDLERRVCHVGANLQEQLEGDMGNSLWRNASNVWLVWNVCCIPAQHLSRPCLHVGVERWALEAPVGKAPLSSSWRNLHVLSARPQREATRC